MKTNPNHPITHLRGADGTTFYDDDIHKSWVEQSKPPLIGLTKREYFAAMAMQGYIAGVRASGDGINIKELCQSAVNTADVLINELNKVK